MIFFFFFPNLVVRGNITRDRKHFGKLFFRRYLDELGIENISENNFAPVLRRYRLNTLHPACRYKEDKHKISGERDIANVYIWQKYGLNSIVLHVAGFELTKRKVY